MKTMGLRRLLLVSPKTYPHADATARASGADDVLADARVCDSLAEAIAGCHYVFGLSARQRSIPWPRMSPRECATFSQQQTDAEIALVFGREHSGLSNEELEACHYHVAIDADPAYPSLNLAAAVQILCYELRMAGLNGEAVAPASLPATVDDVERFIQHLEQVMVESCFLDPARPGHIVRRMRRLYAKAQPDTQDINILRGILTAVQKRHAIDNNS